MGKGMSHLSKEDLRFLQENTKFSKDEIKQWYKGFMVCWCSIVLYVRF